MLRARGGERYDPQVRLAGVGRAVCPGNAGVRPDRASNTDTDKQTAQPTPGATEGAAVQDQASEQQPVNTGDIVITATRRNQALSDVPMAVSAVTAKKLRDTRARRDIRQLNQVAPSLLVSSTSSEAGAAVARIRGIGTVGDNPGLESSVGVFIDGVYRSRTGVGLTELGPLDRIEVLRGPQGTLFGRNTSAGLISIITAKPRFQPEFAGAGRRSAITICVASRSSVDRTDQRHDRRAPRRAST